MSSGVPQKPPRRGNVRFYLRRGETVEYCYFAWFRSQGYDLYWGAANQTFELPPQVVGGISHEISLPEDLLSLPMVASKISYHTSGLVHHTAGGAGTLAFSDEYHGHPQDISGMKLLDVAITAAPQHMGRYPESRSLHRNSSYALIFKLTEQEWTRRLCLEF